MTKKDIKTNAIRILESAGVKYRTASYEYDENNLDAINAAKSAGLNPEQVFKTIVMINDKNQIFVFCTPAEYEISLKKAREITDSKNLDTVHVRDLQKLTGYIRGGCSPLGMIKQYRTFIEESALLNELIYVSAGIRGTFVEINPQDLARLCNAQFLPFI